MSPWVTSVAGASPYGDLLVTVPIAHLAGAQVTVIGYAKPAELDTVRANIWGLGLSPLPYYPHGHGTVSLKSLTQITTSLELSQIPMG
jgi:hypothetical protein